MFDPDHYELIDFGHGKKLERFSGIDVIRDCPAAKGANPSDTVSFNCLDTMSFSRESNRWKGAHRAPDSWEIKHGHVKFGLKPTPFGHVGAFCEQAENWAWFDGISELVSGGNAINLFAYTGGTTLKLASLGTNVVHVDSAKNVVTWARDNAARSGLSDRPVRWIVDDAMTFVQREIKRGKKYDIIVADPPAFGHGGKKASWKIERDLERLIHSLAKICSPDPTAVLFTWHSSGIPESAFRCMVEHAFDLSGKGNLETATLDLVARDGRKLNCGHFFRWHKSSSG